MIESFDIESFNIEETQNRKIKFSIELNVPDEKYEEVNNKINEFIRWCDSQVPKEGITFGEYKSISITKGAQV